MIKILNIIGRRPTGGIGTFVLNYQKHMDSSSVHMDYLLFSDEENGPFDEKVKSMGSTVYVLPALKHSRLFTLRKKLVGFFSDYENQYNIVHLHSANIAFICLPVAKKFGIKRLIIHSHATKYSEKRLNAFRNRILCVGLNKMATDFFACSPDAGKFLFGEGLYNAGKVTVINNAIEAGKFRYSEETRREMRKKLGVENNLVICHTGRFSAQKNHSFLIDIFSNIARKKDNAVLLLAGAGEDFEKIKRKVNGFGLEKKVMFLGVRSDVPDLLQAADAFVLPSIYEGLPYSAIEAQACGLPCAFSNEIANSVNIVNSQFISLEKTAEYWADKIIEACDSFVRRDTIDDVRKAGYDITLEAKNLEDIYCSLICKED